MAPYEAFVAALKRQGLWNHGHPFCPTCPRSKRRGFSIAKATFNGQPSLKFTCARKCDPREIVEALGLDWDTVFTGRAKLDDPFEGEKYAVGLTVRGMIAVGDLFAAAYGLGTFNGSPKRPYRTLNVEQRRMIALAAEIGDRPHGPPMRTPRLDHLVRGALGSLPELRGKDMKRRFPNGRFPSSQAKVSFVSTRCTESVPTKRRFLSFPYLLRCTSRGVMGG
jgi:hypothetical protein